MKPDVSVLLLTRNGMATLPALLDALASQSGGLRFETVAVDSGSSDGSVALLRKRVDRLLEIAPDSFNHGSTRNFGIRLCRGDLVVLIVQDAEPTSPAWLTTLVQPLLDDTRLAGSFARQIARRESSAVTRHYLSQWVAASTEARISRFERPTELDGLPPMQRFLACVFDNVCSCIRRSVWEDIPFPVTPIAEDVEWGREALLAGYGLAFVPEAAVFHSHDRSASYELARTYLVHKRLRALFGLATVPDLASLSRAIVSSTVLHLRCISNDGSPRAFRELPRALALAVALPLGQYLGVRSADSGRDWLRPRGI